MGYEPKRDPEKLTIELQQSDALEYLGSLADECVDVIVTDPPYWTLDRWRNVGTTTRLGGHRDKAQQREEMFFETIDYDYLWQTFLEFDRILKLDGHLYIFCDDQIAPILCNWVREAKDEHRFGDCHLLIWDKVSQGMGYHYRRRYEFILFAWRESRDGVSVPRPRKLRDLGKPDILTCKRVTRGYPTEKPSRLVQELVTQSARIGDILLDPFAGSGVLGVAVPFDWKCRVLLNDKSVRALEYMRKVRFSPELLGCYTLEDHAIKVMMVSR